MTDDKQTILIIDDERFYINLLVDQLSDEYHTVVSKGSERAFERALDGPDLILLDIIMPDMNGYELCQKLKLDKRTRDIPVIFLTVKSELNDEIKGFELGAVDYINKPISPPIVKARVATHIALNNARKILDQKNRILLNEQGIKDEQLRRSEKMAALGKLTGGIAHDFNNVLGIILGYAELVLDKLPDDSPLKDYVIHILKAEERGAKITQKLLAFSRQSSNHPQNVNINDLLGADYNMLAKTLTASIALTLNLEKTLWPVYIDKSDLQDAILNICINAKHAMPAGGSLTFSTQNEYLSSPNSDNLTISAGEYVKLSVTDTGCGMDQQTQDKIFDPFFSTKGNKGTGLGMSQVYGLAKQSRGTVYVESKVGAGTCITLCFPRFKETPFNSEEIKNNTTNEADYFGNETILIVDDEGAIRELIEEMLKNYGYNVLCAENAEVALKFLEIEDINLVLSDVIMPGMDGYEFASIVLKKYPDMKVQIISGFGENNCPGAVSDDLYQHRLQKPVHFITLLKRIRELIDN